MTPTRPIDAALVAWAQDEGQVEVFRESLKSLTREAFSTDSQWWLVEHMRALLAHRDAQLAAAEGKASSVDCMRQEVSRLRQKLVQSVNEQTASEERLFLRAEAAERQLAALRQSFCEKHRAELEAEPDDSGVCIECSEETYVDLANKETRRAQLAERQLAAAHAAKTRAEESELATAAELDEAHAQLAAVRTLADRLETDWTLGHMENKQQWFAAELKTALAGPARVAPRDVTHEYQSRYEGGACEVCHEHKDDAKHGSRVESPRVAPVDRLTPEQRKRFETFRYLRSIVAEVPLHTVSEGGKSLQSTIGFLFELVDQHCPRPEPEGHDG